MPVINFCFCGTCTSAADAGVATNQAIKKFEDHVLLTGVGAEEKRDMVSGINYPTPGTYYRNHKGERQKSFFRMAGTYAFAGNGIPRSGAIRGSGEEDNIAFALAELETAFYEREFEGVDDPLIINIAGFSRGGSAAIRFANEIYEKFHTPIKINLFIQDPNAGFGRHGSQRKIFVPPNVANAFFTFSKDDNSIFLGSYGAHQYEFLGLNTRISAITLPGSHTDQEYQSPDGSWPDAALVNRYLAEQFFLQHGAVKKKNSVLSDMPVIEIDLPLSHDHRKLVGRHGDHEESDLHHIMRGYIAKQMSPKNERSQWQCWRHVPALADLIDELNQMPRGPLRYPTYRLCTALVSEMKAIDYNKQHPKYKAITETANNAVSLVRSLNPAKNSGCIDVSGAKSKLDTFQKTADLGLSYQVRRVASAVAATAAAVIYGATVGAVGGFLSGMLRWKTGFVGGAVMGALCGIVKGAEKAFDVTYRHMAGVNKCHQQRFYDAASAIVSEHKKPVVTDPLRQLVV